jgi:hypothetical protein
MVAAGKRRVRLTLPGDSKHASPPVTAGNRKPLTAKRFWLSYAFVPAVEVAKSRAGGVSVVSRGVASGGYFLTI